MLENSLQLYPSNVDVQKFPTKYEGMQRTNDQRLLHNNYVLSDSDISKDSLVNSMEFVYEFRMMEDHQNINVDYFTTASKNDGKFKFEALKPSINNSREFRVSHTPVEVKN